MKKVKLIAGLCLIAQSLLFFVLFLVYWNRSRNLARTLAAFSAVGGISGAWLVVTQLNESKKLAPSEGAEDEDADDLSDVLEDSFDGDISCAFGAED